MQSVVRKSLAAGFARLAAVLVAFVLTATVTQGLGTEQAGYFLLGFTLVIALSGLLRLGLDNVLLREFGAKGISEAPLKTFAFALRWVVFSSVTISFLGVQFSDFLAVHIFSKPALSDTLFWMSLSLPLVTLFNLTSFVFQGLQRVFAATWFQQLGVGSLFISLFYIVWWLAPSFLDSATSAFLFGGCAFVVALMAVFVWTQVSAERLPRLVLGWKNAPLWSASSKLWGAECMSLMVQWAGVIIAGGLISAPELAYLYAAQRSATVIVLVLMIVNMAVAPRYARLWHEQNYEGMRKLARVSTRTMVVIALPAVVVMLMLPQEVLGLFGEGFEQGAALLMVMAIGQFINVATGSVGYLLNMTGHEKDMWRVTSIAGPLTVVAAYLLTKEYGALGAAYATAFGVSVQNLGALVMVKRRLGFWPLG